MGFIASEPQVLRVSRNGSRLTSLSARTEKWTPIADPNGRIEVTVGPDFQWRVAGPLHAPVSRRNVKPNCETVHERGATPMSAFESYYDENCVPVHEYFEKHKLRFLHSFEILSPHVAPESVVADLGGSGPLAKFLNMDRKAVLVEVKSDLRAPFEVESESCD